MRTSVLQCWLIRLCLFLVLSINGTFSQPDLLYHKLLQRSHAFGMATQDLNEKGQQMVLSHLNLPDVELKESEMSALGSKQDLVEKLEQSAQSSDSLWPRERKAGCKNFYWKGFTSC